MQAIPGRLAQGHRWELSGEAAKAVTLCNPYKRSNICGNSKVCWAVLELREKHLVWKNEHNSDRKIAQPLLTRANLIPSVFWCSCSFSFNNKLNTTNYLQKLHGKDSAQQMYLVEG